MEIRKCIDQFAVYSWELCAEEVMMLTWYEIKWWWYVFVCVADSSPVRCWWGLNEILINIGEPQDEGNMGDVWYNG